MSDSVKWYVVHTYSGYENKVKDTLEKAVENRSMQDRIFEVKVPVEEVIEIINGKKKSVMHKIFPGYVMVKMIMDNETWYVVRNTRGVTGFVGPGSEPVPLSDTEVRAMGVENVHIKIDIEVGETIKVVSGPLKDFVGVVDALFPDRQKLRVTVSMFGRDTPVELDFAEVQRLV